MVATSSVPSSKHHIGSMTHQYVQPPSSKSIGRSTTSETIDVICQDAGGDGCGMSSQQTVQNALISKGLGKEKRLHVRTPLI